MATWNYAPQPDFAAGELVHVSVSGPAGGGDGITLTLMLRDANNVDTTLGTAAGDNFNYEFDVTIPAGATPAAGYRFVTVSDTETQSPTFTIGGGNSRVVLERVARNVHATLAGSAADLNARRRSWAGDDVADLLCAIYVDDAQEEGDTTGGPNGILYWRQSFVLMIWALEQETNSAGPAAATSASEPIDAKIAYLFGQVCKSLLADRQRGGNADNTKITSFSPFNPSELAQPGFALAFDVNYSHSASDPTSVV